MFHFVLIDNSVLKFPLYLFVLKTFLFNLMKIHVVFDQNFSFLQGLYLLPFLSNQRMSLLLFLNFNLFKLSIMQFLLKSLIISLLNLQDFFRPFSSILNLLHQFILFILEHLNSVRKKCGIILHGCITLLCFEESEFFVCGF